MFVYRIVRNENAPVNLRQVKAVFEAAGMRFDVELSEVTYRDR